VTIGRVRVSRWDLSDPSSVATRDGVMTYAQWTDFLFGAEFAAIFWLEQNGYDVSYIAGVDTARFPSSLRQHKVFTSTGMTGCNRPAFSPAAFPTDRRPSARFD
jgi:hypothetical protein